MIAPAAGCARRDITAGPRRLTARLRPRCGGRSGGGSCVVSRHATRTACRLPSPPLAISTLVSAASLESEQTAGYAAFVNRFLQREREGETADGCLCLCVTLCHHTAANSPQPPPLSARGRLSSSAFAHPPLPWPFGTISSASALLLLCLLFDRPGGGSCVVSRHATRTACRLPSPPPGYKHLIPSRGPRVRADDNTTTKQHNDKTTQQHDNTTTRQHDNTITRQHDNTTARPCDHATTQLRVHTSTRQHHNTTTQ